MQQFLICLAVGIGVLFSTLSAQPAYAHRHRHIHWHHHHHKACWWDNFHRHCRWYW